MERLGEIWRRLLFLFRRRQLDRELEEEMRFHLEMKAAEQGAQAARRQFGNVTLLREESREAWGWAVAESLFRDLRCAVRLLWNNPGFTTAAVLTLALGIGANTAVFSVVNAVVFRPLPFEDPERLAMLWEKWEKRGEDRVVVSPENYFGWREQSGSFESMAAIEGNGSTATIGDEPTSVNAVLVTRKFFNILGFNPALGRHFLADDEGKQVAILGHRLWQRLGGSPEIIGKTVEINWKPHFIVGVMPPEFTFPDNSEIWFPMVERELPDHRSHFLRVIGKRQPDVSLAEARSEMNTIAARLDNDPVTGVTIVPLQEQIVGDNQRALVILLAAVACVLLIACANVTNLLLVRAKRRQREIALRLALGAGRWRVVRSLLMESSLLALIGGAAGVAWAYWSVELFVAFDPLRLPRIEEIAVDGSVLLFTFLVAMVTGVLFGLAPALRVSRPDLNEALKEGSERRSLIGGGRSRVRGALAVVQISLAVVLLTSTGLLLRSFVNRISVPLGFRPDGVLGVELPWAAHRRIDEVLERVRSVPGVESAGSGTAFPHRAPGTSGDFSVEGNPEESMLAGQIAVTAGYFRAAGMALRKGRLPTEADGPNAGMVAVVNESLVHQFFAGRDPIGRNVRTTDGTVWRRVIGIVTDVKGFGVDGAPMPTVYIPYQQASWGNNVHLLVRTAVPPASVASAVRQEIRGLNGRWVIGMDTLEGLLADTVTVPRFYLLLVAAFALLALIIAGVGIYGVLNYSVAQRTHELGVRMALGADRDDVRFMVMRQGLLLILSGVVFGVAGAWVSTRALESLLFQVGAKDTGTFAGACILLAAPGLVACYLPARRATRIDPMTALRDQ